MANMKYFEKVKYNLLYSSKRSQGANGDALFNKNNI